LTLHLDLPQTPIWVKGDSLRLSQVLGNVLDNARKFTPRGGRVALRLAAEEESDRAAMRVSDTGIGIPRDVLPRIFDTFIQADRSLDRATGGLGLGLSIARGLVEMHGGTIEASSAGAGQGTEVVIRLPLEPEPPPLEAPPASPSRAEKRSRVLVVEDNRDSAEMLRRMLERTGYQVTVAFTGPEGVEAAQAIVPQVVLCDIGLPGMDGCEVAQALRGNPATSRARLIAVTGYGQEDDRRRTREAGFDVHLVKPVDPQELLLQIGAAQPAS
jgi:CheY-like chemotaxis protein